MAEIFECWFPERGQSMRDSGAYLACYDYEAAQKAAAERCQRDTEWRDHVVAVRRITEDQPKLFDVECRSEPLFFATEHVT